MIKFLEDMDDVEVRIARDATVCVALVALVFYSACAVLFS